MALFDLIQNSNFRLGIWRMEESLDELSSICPLPDTLIHPKRRKEFLSIRALAVTMGISPEGIRHTDSGKPFLAESRLQISISHSKDYACLCLSEKAVGIDIEQPTERLRRLQEHYLSDEELTFLRTQTPPQQTDGRNIAGKDIEREPPLSDLLLYWCAKEAAFKVLDLPAINFKQDLRLTSSAAHRILGLTYREQPYRFEYQEKEDYTWVCCQPC